MNAINAINATNKLQTPFLPMFAKALFLSGWAILCAVSCTTLEETPQKSNLTVGIIKTEIQKGVTSQAEIVQLLGSPNIITKNKQGREIWTYSKQSFKTEASRAGGGLILFGGSQAFSSATSSTFDLIIVFNDQDIVLDYSVVSAQF